MLNHSPWVENLNFPPITVNNLFKFSDQGSDLAPFIGNGTKVKIPSEIKSPLDTSSFDTKGSGLGLLWLWTHVRWKERKEIRNEIENRTNKLEGCIIQYYPI